VSRSRSEHGAESSARQRSQSRALRDTAVRRSGTGAQSRTRAGLARTVTGWQVQLEVRSWRGPSIQPSYFMPVCQFTGMWSRVAIRLRVGVGRHGIARGLASDRAGLTRTRTRHARTQTVRANLKPCQWTERTASGRMQAPAPLLGPRRSGLRSGPARAPLPLRACDRAADAALPRTTRTARAAMRVFYSHDGRPAAGGPTGPTRSGAAHRPASAGGRFRPFPPRQTMGVRPWQQQHCACAM
jgi:hypothetical protein